MHAQIKEQIHEPINALQAIKNITAGQEILVRYGDVKWFETKSIPYSDFDYANTMWRPDLQPLPCRENLRLGTGADGRHSFSILRKYPAKAVLDISLCMDVSLIVVDQFPVLWDFVLIYSKSKTVCASKDAEVCCAPSTHAYLCAKSCRYVSLCPTPRKFRPHPILTSLTCACHS